MSRLTLASLFAVLLLTGCPAKEGGKAPAPTPAAPAKTEAAKPAAAADAGTAEAAKPAAAADAGTTKTEEAKAPAKTTAPAKKAETAKTTKTAAPAKTAEAAKTTKTAAPAKTAETAKTTKTAATAKTAEAKAPAKAAPPSPALVAAGGKVWHAHCRLCHHDGSRTEFRHHPMTNLTSAKFQASITDAELAKRIADGYGKKDAKGKTPMPAFGKKISKAELTAVAAYVRSLKK